MENLHFLSNNILTRLFKELTKYKNCRDMICNPSPKCMRFWPSEYSTINL